MDNQTLQELLQEIRQENEMERGYLKKQLGMMKILVTSMAGILVMLVLAGILLVPRVKEILNRADNTLSQVHETAKHFDQLASSLNDMVEDSNEGVTSAIEKLNQVDIDSLNKSIKDLGNVVEPLAKFFGKFR